MIHVAGGTYLETCTATAWDCLYGSGVRAAAALSELSSNVVLSTYVDKEFQEQADYLANAFGFDLRFAECAKTTWFHYEHGLAEPSIRPDRCHIEKYPALNVSADVVLRFGMLEGDAVVCGRHVVYDPQAAQNPEPFHANGSSSEHLAVVANLREARQLTGAMTACDAANRLLENHQAEVVVIKQGSQGALIATTQGITRVPAFKTPRVWPIGSGDVFAATFAYYWGEKKLPPDEAALKASQSTAYYCATTILPVPPVDQIPSDVLLGPINIGPGREGEFAEKCVYLAGPFFDMGQRWVVEQARSALLNQGLKVFSPLHDVGRGKGPDVAPKDLEGLHQSKTLLAIIDGLDPGTFFEIGYARALGIPAVILAQNVKEEDLKMLEGSGCDVVGDFVTAIYKTAWAYLAS